MVDALLLPRDERDPADDILELSARRNQTVWLNAAKDSEHELDEDIEIQIVDEGSGKDGSGSSSSSSGGGGGGMDAEEMVVLPRVVQGAGGESGLVVLDNTFEPAVLRKLKNLCDESTVFFDIKGGYLGAYLGDGLASGLLLQAATAIRLALPRSVGLHRLTQIWAYKYDSQVKHGIKMHVDQGAYSVNCWLTPDDALQQLPVEGGNASAHLVASELAGGLRLYRGRGVEGRDSALGRRLVNDGFYSVNQNFRTLQRAVVEAQKEQLHEQQLRRQHPYLFQSEDDAPGRVGEASEAVSDEENVQGRPNSRQKNKGGSSVDLGDVPVPERGGVTIVEVPYRENRCVIFRSDLLHETAPLHFKPGYRNRRINLTFMFGDRLGREVGANTRAEGGK